MRRGWTRCAAIAAFGGLVSVAPAAIAAASPPAGSPRYEGGAARAAAVIQPRGGDWEGFGPHGLRMSFELTGVGRSARLHDLTVSLPSRCRVGETPTSYATYYSRASYYPPTRSPAILVRAFTVKPAGDFAIVAIDSRYPQFPVVVLGKFSTRRTGTASVPSPRLKCAAGAWPRTLHFALRAGQRTAVRDGAYSGTLPGPPPGVSGSVHATVVGGGRVLTDFAASWTCADGGGQFELGPSSATGEFIAADGMIDGNWTPEGTWSAQFHAGGQLTGTFNNLGSGDCTQGQNTVFTAMPSGG